MIESESTELQSVSHNYIYYYTILYYNTLLRIILLLYYYGYMR